MLWNLLKRKNVRISLKISKVERELLQRAAGLINESVDQFMARAVHFRVHNILRSVPLQRASRTALDSAFEALDMEEEAGSKILPMPPDPKTNG